MTTLSNTSRRPRFKFRARLAAGVSAVALLAGIGLVEFADAAAVPAAVQVQPQQTYGMPDFRALVEQVKPAVLSVQVDIDPALRTAEGDDQSEPAPSQGENPFKGTPFEHFFDHFRNRGGEPSSPNGGGGSAQHMMALGSGFFISADGYAVTNNHVIDGAAKIEVVTGTGKTLRARLVGADPKTDLALIKVDGGSDFPFVKMAPAMPRVGEWVIAVGNPYGLGGTVTAGIVSAENRDIGSGPYDDFIQIDAPVNRGNSGGPTFNLNGEVIGVNTAIISPSGGSAGIAFDIPTTTVQSVIPVLKEKGHLERAWLGVQIQPVTADIAEGLGLDSAKGAIITGPQPGSPAEKAGLKAGDVITSIDGKPIEDARGLARLIGSMAPDTRAELKLTRDGKEQTLRVTLGAMKEEAKPQLAQAEEKGDQFGKLGLSVAPAPRDGGRNKVGVVVIGVDPAGAAADAGLQPGDVILKIGERAIASPKDIRQALSDIKSHGRSKALVLVKSGGAEHYVTLPASAV